jgi:hypothetical protein
MKKLEKIKKLLESEHTIYFKNREKYKGLLDFDSLEELFYELDEEKGDGLIKFIVYEQIEGGSDNYFSIEILDFEKVLNDVTDVGDEYSIKECEASLKILMDVARLGKHRFIDKIDNFCKEIDYYVNVGRNIKNAILAIYNSRNNEFKELCYGWKHKLYNEIDIKEFSRVYGYSVAIILLEEDIPKNKYKLKEILTKELLSGFWDWRNEDFVKKAIEKWTGIYDEEDEDY